MPAQPTFIPLSETELSEQFTGDPDGLRRYRLLYALRVEQQTQREAALAAGVSERTVRNILRTFAQGGLEALRSRPASARKRRDRRPPAVERALSAALADAPDAGGDTLWRRAQELLGPEGAKLSRRTAYRILAQLRVDRDEDAPNSMRGDVKTALPLLAEEPPLSLGASALAHRFLPSEPEALARGTLIQQALRAALDRLRPAGTVSTIDRSWWPYLICTGEYEAGQTRAELQHDLALSASTYSRAKRQGLDRLAAVLPQIVERMLGSPVALASKQLPRTPDFVGRREEQSYYAWRLQTEGFTHIWGLPGTGKTALAAELAAEGHRYGQTILWHTCRPGRDSTLLGIIRGLAEALAGAGDDELWREIRQTPTEELDASALLNALRECLLARPAVVILDDAHHADADETAALLDALADLVVRRSSRLLLVGREPIEGVVCPPLHGLMEREAELLWTGAAPLPFDQWRALFATTGGLPEPVRRAAALYRRNGDLARPDDWVAEIDAWGTEALWSRLDPHEQTLVAAARELEQRPWSHVTARVCEVLGIPHDTWRQLCRRGLLQIDEGRITVFGPVRAAAQAHLRAEDELRARVAALAIEIDATPIVMPSPESLPDARPASREVGVPLPPSLDLLERVRNALESSAELIQDHGSAEARELAIELAALQEALPELPQPNKPSRRDVSTDTTVGSR